MTQNNSNLCLVIGLIVVVAFAVFYCVGSEQEKFSKSTNKKKSVSRENFVPLAAGALSNAGTFDVNDSYEIIGGPERDVPVSSFSDMVHGGNFRNEIGGNNEDASSFVDMVQGGNYRNELVQQPKTREGFSDMRPGDRLKSVSHMPRHALDVTPFNRSLATPQTSLYQASYSAIANGALRNPYADTSHSTMIRGDAKINYDPGHCIVGISRIGSDALNHGYFSNAGAALYDRHTGGGASYKNLVQHNAGSGYVPGGGNGSGILMDHY